MQIKKTSDQSYRYAKILLMGGAGTGKTHAIGTLPEDKTLILNIVQESGLFTLRNKNFDVLDISTLNDFDKAIEFLKTEEAKKKYQFIGVDSYSQFQKSLQALLEKQGFTGYKLWGLVKDASKKIVDELKVLPYHVIFTVEIKQEKDEEMGTFIYLPSIVGSAKDDVPYWLDEVYFLNKKGKAGEQPTYHLLTNAGSKYPCKSRAGVLPVQIDNPKLNEIIKKLIEVQK